MHSINHRPVIMTMAVQVNVIAMINFWSWKHWRRWARLLLVEWPLTLKPGIYTKILNDHKTKRKYRNWSKGLAWILNGYVWMRDAGRCEKQVSALKDALLHSILLESRILPGTHLIPLKCAHFQVEILHLSSIF